MKKRVISILLAIVMCSTLCTTAFASEENSRQEINLVEAKIEEAIVMFYENKDIGADNNYSKMMDSNIADYLDNKVSTQQYAMDLYGNNKENYVVTVKLLSKEEIGDQLNLTYQVISTYNYIHSRDIDTVVSEEVSIVYDYGKGTIIDFYSPTNYYDATIRGECNERLENISKETIKLRQSNLLKDIDYTYRMENSANEITNINSIAQLTTSTLNYSAIVTYARNNYYKDQPDRGKSTVPYYDFSEIPGNYDCTNFVSHALLAGGAKQYDTGGSGISSTGWYFRTDGNRSSSWTGVTQLYNYMENNTHSNTAAGDSYTYSHSTAYWGSGDVLQLRFSGNSSYSHSTIITRKVLSTDGTRAYAYVTGRTSDSSYNNNQAADDMAPGGSKRTIFVYNN